MLVIFQLYGIKWEVNYSMNILRIYVKPSHSWAHNILSTQENTIFWAVNSEGCNPKSALFLPWTKRKALWWLSAAEVGANTAEKVRLTKDQGDQKLSTSLCNSSLPILLPHTVLSGSAPASKHISHPRPIHMCTPPYMAEHIISGVICSQGDEHCWHLELCTIHHVVQGCAIPALQPALSSCRANSFKVPWREPSLCTLLGLSWAFPHTGKSFAVNTAYSLCSS